MGSIVGKAMDENMKKQQEFMLKTSKLQMERQLQMQNQMRERQMAMMVARSRDLVIWFGSFYFLALIGGTVGAMKLKKPGPFVPVIPLTFIFGYQYDLAYGNKMQRMKDEAERVLANESSMLDLPQGLPSFKTIEKVRLQDKEAERL